MVLSSYFFFILNYDSFNKHFYAAWLAGPFSERQHADPSRD